MSGEDPSENIVAPPGKEDNFFSNTAQEYMAQSQVTIKLKPSDASKTEEERLELARRLMEGKTRQIAWFLHVYVIDKSSSDGEPAEYGGLRAMVLDGPHESESLEASPDDPLAYTYTFKVQVGGTKKLWSKIREDKGLPPDTDVFPLQMAKLSQDELLSFSHHRFEDGEWSPETCNCELETQPIQLLPIKPSNDAYFHYTRMLEDNVMDISVHVGWDYHARYDITHSRTLYKWLVNHLKFTSPVESYEAYNRLSGPLTKTLTVNGRNIDVRVTIFRPDPCESWDEDGPFGAWSTAVDENENNKKRACPDWSWENPDAVANPTTYGGAGRLMQDLKASLKSRDAIIFTGHSGYTYGYALASWYRTSAGDLDPPEIKTLDLPPDKSQLFVMSGCDTYHVAQAFKDNPNKLGLKNADVITTTSYSNARSVQDTKDIISALVGDAFGDLSAVSYGALMDELNPNKYEYSWGYFTMYGIHGIDDNPLQNPLGDPRMTCTPCTQNADCGAVGNVCVRLNATEKICATECLHHDGCDADQACQPFGSSEGGFLKGMACVPRQLSCR